jgi:hypothetical protein
MYAVNMVEEKLIGKQQAVLRVDARQVLEVKLLYAKVIGVNV